VEEGLLVLGNPLAQADGGAGRSHARQIVALARRAEEIGLSSVWLGGQPPHDAILSAPLVILAALAELTTRVRLGAVVTLSAGLDPLRAAEDYAGLDVLSGGRVELAVGGGIARCSRPGSERDPHAMDANLQESVELLLELWNQEDVSWEGLSRTPLRSVTIHPRPLQAPHPPLWIVAGAPASTTLAARLGLGLMLPGLLVPPEALLPRIAGYRSAFAEAGQDPARLRVATSSHVHVARDSQTARQRFEPHLMRYATWAARSGASLPDADLPASDARVASRTPDLESLCRGPCICGSPAEVTDRILAAREALGLDLHLAAFDSGGISQGALYDSLERFGAQVLPHLRTAS
jgi:alkanesulfonate monooxygenase SsuD/methylene tetrahydromethanopterin reductase-like flavin-dependent oxidoreductase (luciferase family)